MGVHDAVSPEVMIEPVWSRVLIVGGVYYCGIVYRGEDGLFEGFAFCCRKSCNIVSPRFVNEDVDCVKSAVLGGLAEVRKHNVQGSPGTKFTHFPAAGPQSAPCATYCYAAN